MLVCSSMPCWCHQSVQSFLMNGAHVNICMKYMFGKSKRAALHYSQSFFFHLFAVPSIQRQEARILLVRGQIRADSAWLRRQGAGWDAVLQPREQMRGRREENSRGVWEKDREKEREPTLLLHVVLCKHLRSSGLLISGSISVREGGREQGEGKGWSPASVIGQASCPSQLSALCLGNLYSFLKKQD